MMRRLMVFGLVLAVLSITPASVYVCGAVTEPERIFQLNGNSQEMGLEVDCSPETPVLLSSMMFSNFLQTGFFTTVAIATFLFSSYFILLDQRLLQKQGRPVLPLTPPPNI